MDRLPGIPRVIYVQTYMAMEIGYGKCQGIVYAYG